MTTNTNGTRIDVITVKRNPYLEEYGNAIRKRGMRQSLNRRRARAVKRKQRLQILCAAVSMGLLALMVLGVSLLVKGYRAAAASGSGAGNTGSVWNAGGAGNAGSAGNAGGAGNASSAGDTGIGGNAAGGKDAAGGWGSGAPQEASGATVQGLPAEIFATHPDWEENFLTPNEYSRPGDELKEVKNIFVHYTANPGTSAAQNRSYFERQKDEHRASVSSHFIIGYDGEIIQCVPLTEIAYAVQTRNFDSISIECCYKAEDGSFTQETYQSLISLLAWLTDAYGLDTEDILRHYDCGGKKCPLYYTEHADKWTQLKEDVKELREQQEK